MASCKRRYRVRRLRMYQLLKSINFARMYGRRSESDTVGPQQPIAQTLPITTDEGKPNRDSGESTTECSE